jgi:hypothetical protein
MTEKKASLEIKPPQDPFNSEVFIRCCEALGVDIKVATPAMRLYMAPMMRIPEEVYTCAIYLAYNGIGCDERQSVFDMSNKLVAKGINYSPSFVLDCVGDAHAKLPINKAQA